MKDTWKKPEGVGERLGVGSGGMVKWKWRQLYLNNNKKYIKNIKKRHMRYQKEKNTYEYLKIQN